MRNLNDLKINKEQLTSLLDLVGQKLDDPNMPAPEEERHTAQSFIKEFKKTIAESQLQFFPLSEIISLMILEQTGSQATLKKQLKKSQKINDLSKEIHQTAQTAPEKLPVLIKIFEELTNQK